MLVFFQCVAESMSAKGFRALAQDLPFGNFLYEVAADVYKRLRERKQQADVRDEIEKMARVAIDEVKQAAVAVAKAALPDDPTRAVELELYLTQIPAIVRQTLRRPSDPSGQTVPAGFSLQRTEDVLGLLPTRVSTFRPGDPLPNREGWSLVEMLGTGGFGEVWLARHPQFESLRRAVKFCPGMTDRDRALLHEGGLIDRVMLAGSIPNVVPLIDADLTGAVPWLMYEYCGGGDLVKLATGWAKLVPARRHEQALASLRQVATAVAHFHRLGVVHRDLKPANVLIGFTSSGKPKLMVGDFGIGGVAARKELDAGEARTSRAERISTAARGAFTPHYASPQQKKGFPPDPRDDVYALGVIGYQLFVGDVTAERPGGKGWRRELLAQGVNPDLLDTFESCWDDDPAERPKDAGELLDRLRPAAAEDLPPEDAPPKGPRPKGTRPKDTRPKPEPAPSKRVPWALALVGLALLAALGMVALVALWSTGESAGPQPKQSATEWKAPDTYKAPYVPPSKPSWVLGNGSLDPSFILGDWSSTGGNSAAEQGFPRSLMFRSDGTVECEVVKAVDVEKEATTNGVSTRYVVKEYVAAMELRKYQVDLDTVKVGGEYLKDLVLSVVDQTTVRARHGSTTPGGPGSQSTTYSRGKTPTGTAPPPAAMPVPPVAMPGPAPTSGKQ